MKKYLIISNISISWGRGEGGYGAPPDRHGTSRDGVAPASRGGAKNPGGGRVWSRQWARRERDARKEGEGGTQRQRGVRPGSAADDVA